MSTVQREQYLYLTSYIRAKETRLLTGERLLRMAESADFDEAARLLTDCGYPELSGVSDRELEAALTRHREEVFHELEGLCPEKDLVTAFRIRYDYHNAKTLIKAEAARTDGAPLLSESGRVPLKKILDAFADDSWSDIPPTLAQSVRKARAVMARTGNPQLADITLDKAYFAELRTIAASLSTDFYSGYVRLSIDLANLRTAVRCLRGHMDRGILEAAFIPGGSFSLDRLESTADNGFSGLFRGRSLTGAAELGQAAVEGASLAPFERACDNALTDYLRDAKMESFGPAAVVSYLACLEGELIAVRMILLGKRAELPADTLKERLRDSYV